MLTCHHVLDQRYVVLPIFIVNRHTQHLPGTNMSDSSVPAVKRPNTSKTRVMYPDVGSLLSLCISGHRNSKAKHIRKLTSPSPNTTLHAKKRFGYAYTSSRKVNGSPFHQRRLQLSPLCDQSPWSNNPLRHVQTAMISFRTSHHYGDIQRLGQCFEGLAFWSIRCRAVGVVRFRPAQPGAIGFKPDVEWVSR